MHAHVVFDKYHEYMTMDIFNLLFPELITNKRMRGEYNKNILLISTTPPHLYLEDIIVLHEDDVIEMASFNQSDYQIEFIEYNDESINENPFYKNIQIILSSLVILPLPKPLNSVLFIKKIVKTPYYFTLNSNEVIKNIGSMKL